MEAALSCIADYGYQGATVRRIAERAEVTAGLVRHHFAGKDALLVETYRHINQVALDRIAQATVSGHSGIESALDAAIRALFPEDLRNPHQMRIMVAFWGLVLTSPEIADIQKANNAALQANLVRLIETHMGPRDDVADVAYAIIALADGLWLECCLNPERMTPERAVGIATRFSCASLGLSADRP